jgi:hypothetical protein
MTYFKKVSRRQFSSASSGITRVLLVKLNIYCSSNLHDINFFQGAVAGGASSLGLQTKQRSYIWVRTESDIHVDKLNVFLNISFCKSSIIFFGSFHFSQADIHWLSAFFAENAKRKIFLCVTNKLREERDKNLLNVNFFLQLFMQRFEDFCRNKKG